MTPAGKGGKWPESEVELGRVVAAWLERAGWELHHEVVVAGESCDLVAVRDDVLWAIELKRVLSFEVVAQARRWADYANLASVTVPFKHRGTAGDVAARCCEREGVGLLLASSDGIVREAAKAPRHDNILPALGASLRPEQASGAFGEAGANDARRWTRFKETVALLRALAAASPGIPIAQAVASVRHHYASNASAQRCLTDLIDDGKVAGLRLESAAGGARLYASEAL